MAGTVETRKRSIVKALSWRFFATLITSVVAFVVTGELAIAIEVGLLDTVIKLGAYYLHERTWLRVKWGMSKFRGYQI